MTRPTKRQTLSYNVNFYTPYIVDAGTPDDSRMDEDTELDSGNNHQTLQNMEIDLVYDPDLIFMPR